mmetsp:Transcript_38380/g.39056  ORF Transcript_38380/g.39056 Transcript_38380/m.39056 type:complete len:297 (+) Transcript_38380:39-929(+)
MIRIIISLFIMSKSRSATIPLKNFFNNNFALSSRFGQGSIKYDRSLGGHVITVSRISRDVDEDRVRSTLESYISLPTRENLCKLPTSACEISPASFLDTSPSGKKSLVARLGKDDAPILEYSGSENKAGYRIDASKVHGKIIGDSWFGGCSWSSDERFVAYVASKRGEKKATYFNEEVDESLRGNHFEYEEDWGEKYTGVSSLVICVLDTLKGTITPINGPESPEKWTIGQPVWAPCSDTEKPVYLLAYTAWETGTSRLGMIYCYQRPCSIFLVDLTALLTTPSSPSLSVSLSLSL